MRTDMRHVLALCVELDQLAHDTYARFAETCGDDELRTVFDKMAREEAQHVGWWKGLAEAAESGSIPEIDDPDDLFARLNALRDELHSSLPDSIASLSTDEMLDLSARMEFFMLDPVFGRLTDLMRDIGHFDPHEAYSRHVLRLIETIELKHSEKGLASFLARVLRRTYLNQQELAVLATRDQLTGVHNRRGLLNMLEHALAWSSRYDRPLGVVALDIDHFKQINDRWGHLMGDAALGSVAATLSEVVRSSDSVGRMGGDEFVIVAPETSARDLDQLMRRIVETVRERTFAGIGTITVSVGGAFIEGGSSLASYEDLIGAADRSLYAAKEAGRDGWGPAIHAHAGDAERHALDS